jgi:hypothetical protein
MSDDNYLRTKGWGSPPVDNIPSRRKKLAAFLLAVVIFGSIAISAVAQDTTTSGGDPTIEVGTPTIPVADSDNALPDWMNDATPVTMWVTIASIISAPLTGLLLRAIRKYKRDAPTDRAQRWAAGWTSVVVSLLGAYFTGTLDNWQPTVTGVFLVIILAQNAYDKVQPIRSLARTLEGA